MMQVPKNDSLNFGEEKLVEAIQNVEKAIEKNDTEKVKKSLEEIRRLISQKPVNGMNAFVNPRINLHNFSEEKRYIYYKKLISLAEYNKDEKLYKRLIELAIKIKDVNLFNHLIELAIKKDDAQLFRMIIVHYTPNSSEFKNATGQIKQLLEYKPARRKKYRDNLPDIKEICTSRSRNEEKLKAMLEDQENTSDEDSSDSENDEPQFLKNHNHSDKNIFYRGVYLHPDYFKNSQERHITRTQEYHQKPVYSSAVVKLAERLPRKSDNSLDYENADRLVKNYFEFLKLTPDKQERYENGRINNNRSSFDSLYQHFIQAYKNSYDELVNKGGLTRNFNFMSNDNPIVSTSENQTKATEYVQRLIKSSDDKKPLKFKLRKTTRKLKQRRRIGYLQVFAMNDESVKKHALSMNYLQQQGSIKISHHYQFDSEVFFESSIPKEFILGYQIFALPDFNQQWSKQIQTYFGLDNVTYNQCREIFLKGKTLKKESLELIINIVTTYQAKGLNAAINKHSEIQHSKNINLQNPAIQSSQSKNSFFSTNNQVQNEIITGTSNTGEKIQFERHKIEGGLQGECGIIAMPIANKKQLYDDILRALENNEHPFHNQLLELIGNDIMQLISLPNPDITLENSMQMALKQLVLDYQSEPNEINRLKVEQACRQVNVCLSYLNDDLKQRNWVSISILRSWAILNNLNLRIWQIQAGNQATVLIENIIDTSSSVHEILYVNGNHFDLLQKVEEQNINELIDTFSKQATL